MSIYYCVLVFLSFSSGHVICNPFHSLSWLFSVCLFFSAFVCQASTRGLNTSLAQGAWLYSPAFTWRPATSQSHPSKPALNWKPTTSGRAATGTPTPRSLCINCAVRSSLKVFLGLVTFFKNAQLIAWFTSFGQLLLSDHFFSRA